MSNWRNIRWRDAWTFAKDVASDFVDDSAMSHAAALAFYTALGLAPLVILFLAAAVMLGEETKEAMINEIRAILGSQASEGLDMVIQSAERRPATGIVAAAIGLATVLVSATGVFAQLQSALNHIWEVRARPGRGLWRWVRARLLSLGLLLSALFLLMVSLVISAVVNAILPHGGAWLNAVNIVASLVLFSVLFALMFKHLPDVVIAWRDVWFGATVTAVLWTLGRHLIGVYLGNSSVASSYGAAGSLVALLVWVYYSAVIMLLGAEITQVIARRRGAEIRPSPHATAA
jgi:membrane protein